MINVIAFALVVLSSRDDLACFQVKIISTKRQGFVNPPTSGQAKDQQCLPPLFRFARQALRQCGNVACVIHALEIFLCHDCSNLVRFSYEAKLRNGWQIAPVVSNGEGSFQVTQVVVDCGRGDGRARFFTRVATPVGNEAVNKLSGNCGHSYWLAMSLEVVKCYLLRRACSDGLAGQDFLFVFLSKRRPLSAVNWLIRASRKLSLDLPLELLGIGLAADGFRPTAPTCIVPAN